jgi:nicotinamidase-related amidase
MQHQNTLILTQSALTIIDMQEAFRNKISDFSDVTERIATMVKAAKLLKLPIVVTEQYPKGLGHTAEELVK